MDDGRGRFFRSAVARDSGYEPKLHFAAQMILIGTLLMLLLVLAQDRFVLAFDAG